MVRPHTLPGVPLEAQADPVALVTTVERLLARVFIDSQWVHRFWGCHRLTERSFHLRGRQFHICARCTGLTSGAGLSLLVLPWRQVAPTIFLVAALILAADGLSQLVGMRTSNNIIRFATGFTCGLTALSAVLVLGGF